MKVAIIGAGAAGMFCAANLSQKIEIDIYEATRFPLSKVRASGGGRCNFTNDNIDTSNLAEFYPRGAGSLKKPMRRFGAKDTRAFFETLGVKTKTEDAGRVFPSCDDSRAIAFSLKDMAENNGAKILLEERVDKISKRADGIFEISSNGKIRFYNAVVVCVGGLTDSPLKNCLSDLGIAIEEIAPSLFSLKTDSAKDPKWSELSGASVANAELRAEFNDAKKNERKIIAKGSLLFTHFGIGGPATLKFSSFGARVFKKAEYNFPFTINFAPKYSEEERTKSIIQARKNLAKKRIVNAPLFDIPQKIWAYISESSGVTREYTFANLPKQIEQNLTKNIFAFNTYCIGRSAHKAEFVSCGGIAREEIDFATMGAKKIPNLYFAGECIDIDAITGGFNLQAAWTTAKICSESINKTSENI